MRPEGLVDSNVTFYFSNELGVFRWNREINAARPTNENNFISL